jgi:hypothetical protein
MFPYRGARSTVLSNLAFSGAGSLTYRKCALFANSKILTASTFVSESIEPGTLCTQSLRADSLNIAEW